MKVKKFTCHQCGASKTKSFTGIFITCDHCYQFFAIDFQRHSKLWNSDTFRIEKWEEFKLNQHFIREDAIHARDKKKLKRLYFDRFIMYSKLYEYAYPPTVNTAELKNRFTIGYAEYSTDLALTGPACLTPTTYLNYHESSTGEFTKAIEQYNEQLEHEISFIYKNKAYETYTKHWPEYIYKQVKLYRFIQSMLGNIDFEYLIPILKKWGLQNEFDELNNQTKQEKSCTKCGKTIAIKNGTDRYKCPDCNHENLFRSTINCYNCGQENIIKSQWTSSIECSNCKTFLRILSQ